MMKPIRLLLLSASFARATTCFVPPSSSRRTSHVDRKDSRRADLVTRRLHNPQGDYLLSLGRISEETDGTERRELASPASGPGQKMSAGGDPYAPGVAEAYGLIDSTVEDGFDSAADAVGPGIYGGSVRRDPATGAVLFGTQHENHNHRPGPLYDGNGYSLSSRAIQTGDEETVRRLLREYPQLIDEVGTGGSRPLHVCGMSPAGQRCARAFVDAGADVHALDTYGYNALHRMASNDLEVGAEALVMAGLDPNGKAEEADSTPIEIAKRQRAIRFLMAMQRLGHYD